MQVEPLRKIVAESLHQVSERAPPRALRRVAQTRAVRVDGENHGIRRPGCCVRAYTTRAPFFASSGTTLDLCPCIVSQE